MALLLIFPLLFLGHILLLSFFQLIFSLYVAIPVVGINAPLTMLSFQRLTSLPLIIVIVCFLIAQIEIASEANVFLEHVLFHISVAHLNALTATLRHTVSS